MKTIIAGSRNLVEYEEVCIAMEKFCDEVTEVVSGGAQGADKLGEQWAEHRDIPIKRFPYESRYGRAGGPIRNRKMAEYADALVAIWDGISPGTKNMIDEATKRNLKIWIRLTR